MFNNDSALLETLEELITVDSRVVYLAPRAVYSGVVIDTDPDAQEALVRFFVPDVRMWQLNWIGLVDLMIETTWKAEMDAMITRRDTAAG